MDRNVKVKCKTIKFLGKNTDNLYDLWFSQNFIYSTYKISCIGKNTSSVFKIFFPWKTTLMKWKGNHSLGETFTMHISDEGLELNKV